MKKAWFFGDSFIHGTGCRDKIDDKNKIVSQIVSEKLNLEEINLSCMGYSNENIIFSIITNLENIEKGDYVFMFDTYSVRSPFVRDTLSFYKGWPSGSYFPMPNEEWDSFHSARTDLTNNLLNYYQTIFNHFNSHLNKLGVNSFYYPSENNFWHKHKFELQPQSEGGHWSFKGHQQVASFILNPILKGKII